MLNIIKLTFCACFLTSLVVARMQDTSSSEENTNGISARDYEALVSTAQRGMLAQILLQHLPKPDSLDDQEENDVIEEQSRTKHKRFNRYQTGSTRSRAKLLQEIREKIHGERRG